MLYSALNWIYREVKVSRCDIPVKELEAENRTG